MNIQKEREAFDAQFAPPENGHFLDAVGESDPIQESITFKSNWMGWLKCAESKQAEIDDLKARLKAVHDSRIAFVEYCRKVESSDFVLVPKEPTPKMIDATWAFHYEIRCMSDNARNEFIYKAMIEVAKDLEKALKNG